MDGNIYEDLQPDNIDAGDIDEVIGGRKSTEDNVMELMQTFSSWCEVEPSDCVRKAGGIDDDTLDDVYVTPEEPVETLEEMIEDTAIQDPAPVVSPAEQINEELSEQYTGSGDYLPDLSSVEANSKKYEMLSVKSDPLYSQFKASIDIVREFIIEKGLIVYGGTAIDYALRLKGDFIYPDDLLAIPDLDVFSSDSVNDAYMLADRLYRKGYKETRAIRAFYVRAMRVDIGDKRWVADISFVPKDIFMRLPTVEYEGMKVIHPDFQRIDLHSSLSFPFDNPPKEVIFDRWRKDITRFNKLSKAYPVSGAKPDGKMMTVKIPMEFSKWVLHGWGAYAVLYTELLNLVKKMKADEAVMKDVIKSGFSIKDDKMVFPSLGGKAEFVHFNPYEILHGGKLNNVKKYASVLSVIPKRYVTSNATTGNIPVQIFSSENRLLCIGACNVDGKRIKCSGIQYLLEYFISGAYFTDLLDDTPSRATYLAYYESTLSMIRTAESLLKNTILTLEDDDLNKSLWFPNVYVYGDNNISDSLQATLQQVKIDIGTETEKLPLPVNYYPARGGEHPKFDYENNQFFMKDGKELHD